MQGIRPNMQRTRGGSRGGGGGGAGSWRFSGTPKLHKEEKNVAYMHTNTPRFST